MKLLVTGAIPVLLLAIALAADAFAVALTQGARFRPGWQQALAMAAVFGGLQGVMPLIGLALGIAAFAYVEQISPWIAFALLAFIGLQMIRASGADDAPAPALTGTALLMAGIATSIDALAAGVTLPALTSTPLAACLVIAFITAVLSAAGVKLGALAGDRFGRVAEIGGGVILLALGTKILGQHWGYI